MHLSCTPCTPFVMEFFIVTKLLHYKITIVQFVLHLNHQDAYRSELRHWRHSTSSWICFYSRSRRKDPPTVKNLVRHVRGSGFMMKETTKQDGYCASTNAVRMREKRKEVAYLAKENEKRRNRRREERKKKEEDEVRRSPPR